MTGTTTQTTRRPLVRRDFLRSFFNNLDSRVLGMVLWSSAWAAVALQYSTTSGLVAAAVAAGAGSTTGRWVAAKSPRLSTMLPACLLVWLLLLFAGSQLREWTWVWSLLGAGAANSLVEAAVWGGAALCLSFALEIVRPVFPEIGGVRILLALASFASLLAAHRDGAHHRPYPIVDHLLLHGHDPVNFFLLTGLLIGVAVVLFGHIAPRVQGKHMRNAFLLVALLLLLPLLLPVSLPRIVREAQQAGGAAGRHGKGSNSGANQKNNHGNGKDDQLNQDPNLSFLPPPDAKPIPVAVVTLHDDYTPPSGTPFYFRQTVLTLLAHDQIVSDGDRQYTRDTADSFPIEPMRVGGTKPEKAQKVRTTITLLAPHSRPFGLVTPIFFAPAKNPDPEHFVRAYEAESMAPATPYERLLFLPAGSPSGSDPQALRYFTAAPQDPRFHAVANEAMAKLSPALMRFPLARAWAIKMWLEDHVTYDLRETHADSSNPVADFLFGNRIGYCVHNAQAAVLMFRTAGIPARVSEGYMVSARQRGHGSTLLIRDVNAHAWPEIYLSGVGWTVVDIYPKHHVGPLPEPVDPVEQLVLGRMATPDSKQQSQEQSNAQHKGSTASLLRRLRMALASLVLIFLLQLYLRKIWSRVAIYVCPAADLPRASLRAALCCAADAGMVRRYGVTREQFAQSLFPAVPGLEPLTRLHARASLGRTAATEPLPPSTWPLRRHDYVALYRAVTRQVRVKQPGWRRVLGWLSPATAWQVR